ncbi:MAG: hypothetical protein JXA57_10620 [Armatimonadetes bacterium]|nr:hypothetical protein [Armatimonadota bacterium]
MPELGEVKNGPAFCAVYMMAWAGFPPTLRKTWMDLGYLQQRYSEGVARDLGWAIRSLETGTVIDVEALPEVVVLSEPGQAEVGAHLSDEGLLALEREADAMGRGE